MGLFRLPRPEIDVGESVQLRHDDVAVVGADAGREGCDPFPVVPACDRHKLPVGVAELFVGQEFPDHVPPARVPDKNHCVGDLLRSQVDVERGPVGVDDKFRFRYSHGFSF